MRLSQNFTGKGDIMPMSIPEAGNTKLTVKKLELYLK
jgi:hypothetical protein